MPGAFEVPVPEIDEVAARLERVKAERAEAAARSSP
jgi:hypothetical protein